MSAAASVRSVLQRLGAEALVRLEHKLVTYGKSNVLELLQASMGSAPVLCADRDQRQCCMCHTE